MHTITDWLLEGDPAIRWQTQRDLLDASPRRWRAEQRRTATTGWGAQFLAQQTRSGGWGGGLYSPKWTSTTYTLLDLHHLGLPRDNAAAQRGLNLIVAGMLGGDDEAAFARALKREDLCIVGMELELIAYFGQRPARSGDLTAHRASDLAARRASDLTARRASDLAARRASDLTARRASDLAARRIDPLVARLLEAQMPDGGWNCRLGRDKHVVHSSLHTTLNVLDGLRTAIECGLKRRRADVEAAEARAREFLLAHRFYRSHRTGEIINPVFTMLSYPHRWHYDILRGLEYFQRAGAERDPRVQDAITLLESKRLKDGTWPVQQRHSGLRHFDMERIGKPSRWNTLRALRVLRWWGEGA